MSNEFLSLSVMELGPEELNLLEHWEKLMDSGSEPELKCYILTSGASLVCCKLGETKDKILVGFPCSRGVKVSDSRVRTEVIPFCRPPVIWIWKTNIEWEHVPYAESEFYFCEFLLSHANFYIPEFLNQKSVEFLEERKDIAGFIIKDNPIETMDALKAIGREDLLDEYEGTEVEISPTLH